MSPVLLLIPAFVIGALAFSRIGDVAGLSPRRDAILKAVDRVIPGVYPDAKFRLMAPGYDPNDPKLPKNFTTCGFMPGYAGNAVGIDTRYGLKSIQDIGEQTGTWVKPSSGKRPKPGDFFLLGNAAGEILHTGVFKKTDGTDWETADAGQEDRQKGEKGRTAYVKRTWNPDAMTLKSGNVERNLLGWLNVDDYPIPGVKSGQLKAA